MTLVVHGGKWRESGSLWGVKLISPIFFIQKGRSRRPIVAIIPRRDHGSTYPLGAVQEWPRRWEPQALLQVRA